MVWTWFSDNHCYWYLGFKWVGYWFFFQIILDLNGILWNYSYFELRIKKIMKVEMILAVDKKKKLKKFRFDWNLSPDLCNTSCRKAWSLAGFTSLMGRALWLVSQRSGLDSWKSPGFCRFFFNRLGCLFNCEDYFHFKYWTYLYQNNIACNITCK